MKNRLLPLVLLLLVGAQALPALAQSANSREQEQIRRLRTQLQQASRDLAEAQAGREAAERSLQEAQAARQSAEREAGREGAARRGFASRLEQASAEKVRLDDSLAEARQALEVRATELSASRSEGERLRIELAGERGRLKQLDGELGQCTADNAELVVSARELMQRYAGKGVADVLSATDPVLGLGRVRMENLLEQYGDRIAGHELAAKKQGALGVPGE